MDFVTFNGDVIGHDISVKGENVSVDDAKTRINALHTQIQQMFTKYMPNTPVIVTFGNNDSYDHDSAVSQADKQEFYGLLYKLWFKNHPGNRKFDTPDNYKTFMDGGYFRFDINSNLSVLSYNSMENSIDQDVT